MKKSSLSRRQFVERTALGLSAGAIGMPITKGQSNKLTTLKRLPREVWIGSISLMGLSANDSADMTEKALGLMENLLPYQPDIICLPEVFAYTNLRQDFEVKKVAEKVPGHVVQPFVNFAERHQCYVICPTYSLYNGAIYIAAVLIDRRGKVVGEYHKARPTESEMESGVRPGPLKPPVFETDFGKIGIQICFDIKWDQGWQQLKAAGAEIIFWPSAYAGGREISSRAWRHQLYVVSSTLKDTSKICDLTGEAVAQTGRWQPNWVCAPVNLEKAFLHTWPAVQKFNQIHEKYGRRIKLTTFDEEEWTILESLDPEVKVADILAEFELKTHHELMSYSASVQEKNR